MPRRPRVFVDGVIYHLDRRFAHGARVFAAPKEAFELQVDAIGVELRRRLCIRGAILDLPTTPDLVPVPRPPDRRQATGDEDPRRLGISRCAHPRPLPQTRKTGGGRRRGLALASRDLHRDSGRHRCVDIHRLGGRVDGHNQRIPGQSIPPTEPLASPPPSRHRKDSNEISRGQGRRGPPPAVRMNRASAALVRSDSPPRVRLAGPGRPILFLASCRLVETLSERSRLLGRADKIESKPV